MSEFTKRYAEECVKADKRLQSILELAKSGAEIEGLGDDDFSNRIRLAREAGYLQGTLRTVLYELACEKALNAQMPEVRSNTANS